MGKQIEFFMTCKDESEFLRKVSEYKGVFINDKGLQMTLEEVGVSNSLSLFIVLSDAYLYKSTSGFLDAIVSEAVQFSRGMRREECIIRSSRLWAEFKYYDSNKNLITKSKQFNDIFNIYVKLIKKNYRRSKCKNYYIGNEAYKLYKEYSYSMLAGPKHMVEFD
jgi:hypothetical protein